MILAPKKLVLKNLPSHRVPSEACGVQSFSATGTMYVDSGCHGIVFFGDLKGCMMLDGFTLQTLTFETWQCVPKIEVRTVLKGTRHRKGQHPTPPEGRKFTLTKDVGRPRILLPNEPPPHVHGDPLGWGWSFHPQCDQLTPKTTAVQLIFNSPGCLSLGKMV